jgi:hypothetical protein
MFSSVTCWNEKKKHILDVKNASLESLTACWVLGIFMVVGQCSSFLGKNIILALFAMDTLLDLISQ